MRGRARPVVLLAALFLGMAWAGGASAQDPAPSVPAQPIAPVDRIAPADGAGAEGGMPTRTIETPPDSPQMVAAPILTVDQNTLFTGSAWGRRTQSVLEEEGGKIAAENERLAAQLSDEEAALTSRRETLDPAEFRKQAEAFDERATRVRRERAQAVQALNDWAETDRSAFYRAALPVMGEMMQDRRAVAVLDRRTVFVSLDAIDITADLVLRLDERLGDGAGQVPLPSAQGDGQAPAAEIPQPPAAAD